MIPKLSYDEITEIINTLVVEQRRLLAEETRKEKIRQEVRKIDEYVYKYIQKNRTNSNSEPAHIVRERLLIDLMERFDNNISQN